MLYFLQIQNLKDQLIKAHMLIEKADFLNTTQEEQEKTLENIRAKIADRRYRQPWASCVCGHGCIIHCVSPHPPRELMEKYTQVDYNNLMRSGHLGHRL